MRKLVIPALGAVALAAAAPAAFADDHMDASGATALETATHAVTGSSEDRGWDALTPQHTGVVTGAERTIDLSFTPYARMENVGDLEHDAGDVDVDRYGVELRMDYTDENSNPWSFRWGWEESDYDLDGAPAGSAADGAFDDVTAWSISFGHQRVVEDRWTAFASVGVQFAGADGVSFSDGHNWMGAIGGIYEVDENLDAGLGVIVSEDFDDSVEVLPMPMLTYRIDENNVIRWRGTRADFLHRVDDHITLRGLLEWEMRSFRIDDDALGAPDGAVNDSRVRLGGGADYAVNEWFTVRGELGLIFEQEYEIEDDDGSRIDSVDGDDVGLFVGVAAILTF